jgi:hypothetical protein
MQVSFIALLDRMIEVQIDACDDASKDDQSQECGYAAPKFALGIGHDSDSAEGCCPSGLAALA